MRERSFREISGRPSPLKEPGSDLHRLLIYITVDQQAAQSDLSINALTPRDLILHEIQSLQPSHPKISLTCL
jgi:hypothetical protein